jgi:beta-lactamase class A
MILFRGRKKDGSDKYEEDRASSTSRGRKRKELPKQWGRKERLVILFVLIFTTGVSGVLFASARSWKLPGFPRIGLSSLETLLFREKTIILEGNKKEQIKASEAKSRFRQITKDLSGIWGLYVVRLGEGTSYGINENEVFQAASLIKLPVILSMYRYAEEGSINLDDKYILKDSDKVAGSGSLYSRPEGFEVTYRSLVNLMGEQSDNTAFKICMGYLGEEKISEMIREIGMINTSLEDNTTTPYDIGLFFKELWKESVVSEESQDEILNSLTDTIYEEHLAAGVPDNVRVAHKFGREVHVVNDAGVVFFNEPYVLVIMSKGVVDQEADEVFPNLAKVIYEVESGN